MITFHLIGDSLVTAYVINRRKNSENDVESMMFQVELKAYSANGDRVFFSENICRYPDNLLRMYQEFSLSF